MDMQRLPLEANLWKYSQSMDRHMKNVRNTRDTALFRHYAAKYCLHKGSAERAAIEERQEYPSG